MTKMENMVELNVPVRNDIVHRAGRACSSLPPFIQHILHEPTVF